MRHLPDWESFTDAEYFLPVDVPENVLFCFHFLLSASLRRSETRHRGAPSSFFQKEIALC